MLDRPGVAASALAAVVALRLAAGDAPPGAMGVAGLDGPLPQLQELARRGVRTAVFDGAAHRAATADLR